MVREIRAENSIEQVVELFISTPCTPPKGHFFAHGGLRDTNRHDTDEYKLTPPFVTSASQATGAYRQKVSAKHIALVAGFRAELMRNP
jgi:hypothetical protein